MARDRYGYVSRETWWTRYWLLGHKIASQGAPTWNDRRAAEILLRFAKRFEGFPSAPQGAEATKNLSKVVEDGNKERQAALRAIAAPEAGLGS